MLAEARTHTREEDSDWRRASSVGCVAEAKHYVVFARRASARCSEVDWVAALTRCDGSAVVANQITLVPVAERVGTKRFYAAFDFSATRVETAALFACENV